MHTNDTNIIGGELKRKGNMKFIKALIIEYRARKWLNSRLEHLTNKGLLK